MQTHKFAAGQTVMFVPGGNERKYGGLFEVVVRLPDEHGQHQYRIRSRHDGHQRVVWEYQLAPLAADAVTTPPGRRPSGASR